MTDPTPVNAGAPPRSKSRSKFVRDTAILQFGTLVTMGTYLFTSVILARGLGPRDFGRYTLAFSLYSVAFFVVNLGVTTITVSEYAKACGANDERAKVTALAAFLKVFSLMTVLLLVLGLALPALAGWLYLDRTVGYCALALCLLGPAQMLNAFQLVVQQGARRMTQFVIYDNACGIVRVVLLVFAVIGYFRLEAVIVAYVISALISSALGLHLYRLMRIDTAPQARPPPLADVLRAIPSAKVRGLVGTSTIVALTKNCQELVRNMAMLMIGNTVGVIDVAHFRVAYYYVWAINQLLSGLSRNILPSLGFRLGQAQGDMHAFRRDLVKIALTSGVLFLAITLAFALAAPFAVAWLYGPHYEGSVRLVRIMVLGSCVLGFAVAVDAFYIYTKQTVLMAKVNMVCLLAIASPTGYVLIRRYGVVGAAWFIAGIAWFSIVHLIVIYRYFRRHRNEPPGSLGSSAIATQNGALPEVPDSVPDANRLE